MFWRAKDFKLGLENDDATEDLAERRMQMRAVALGDRHAAALHAAPLLAALSRDALDLLGVILRERPATIADLVSLTGRASQTSRDRSNTLRSMD